MATATAPGLVASRLLLLAAFLLWLVGCVPPRNVVLFRNDVNTRLATRHYDGLFFTQVHIGDREVGPFLIDSGAGSLFLDSELGKTLDIPLSGEGDEPRMKQPYKWGTLASLSVGPMTLQNTGVTILDLSALTDILGERLGGLLGAPFFAQAIVEIDYPAGSITVFDPKSYRLPRGEWLPVTVRSNRPLVPARLEGDIEGEFLVDTGSTHSVIFHPGFIRKHGLLENRETRPQKTQRVEGLYETLAGEIAWFELGGHRFEQPTVTFARADMTDVYTDRVAGIIGERFLRHFVVVLNYPEGKIALLPR
jgi:hypothetical protein